MTVSHRLWLSACLLALGANVFLTAQAQPKLSSLQPPFAVDVPHEPSLLTDTRLQTRITLDEVGTPLGELLQKLSNKGLMLKCGDSCVNQKVHIRLKDRPLYVLLQSLTELLPGTWTPMTNNVGYRLEMTSKAVRYREDYWATLQGERDRALQAQREYVLARMRRQLPREAPANQTEDITTPEMAERAWQKQEFWRQLPAALQERIAGAMSTKGFFAQDGGVSGYPKEGNIIVPLSELGTESEQRLRAKLPALPAGQDANVEFCNLGYTVAPIVTLPNQTLRTSINPLGVSFAPDAAILNPNMLAMEMKKRGRNAPDAWKKLAAYEQSHVWTTGAVALQEHRMTPPRRAEALDWLADKADLEFVADYYSRNETPLSLSQKQSKPSRPLKAELDFLATEHDMSWRKRDDGIYLARDNRWYKEDYYEVPASLLRAWMASPLPDIKRGTDGKPDMNTVLTRIAAQLDLQADMAARLTPWQIGNGLNYFVDEKGSRQFDPEHPDHNYRPLAYLASHILSDYSLFEFVNTLSSEQRRALLNGKLPATALDAKQQERALYLLPDLQLRLARQPANSILLDLSCEMPRFESLTGYNSSMGRPDMFNFSLIVAGDKSSPGSALPK